MFEHWMSRSKHLLPAVLVPAFMSSAETQRLLFGEPLLGEGMLAEWVEHQQELQIILPIHKVNRKRSGEHSVIFLCRAGWK